MEQQKTNIRTLLITSARENGWLEDKSNPSVQKLYHFSELVDKSDGNVELAITSLDRLEFSIVDGEASIYDLETKKDLKEYDAIHLRGIHRDMVYFTDFAKAIQLYVEKHGKRIIDPVDVGPAFGKLAQGFLFALNGVPVPDTWSRWNGPDLIEYILKWQVSFPLIVKATSGLMGMDNHLVGDEAALRSVLVDAETPFIAQTQIPNSGDYRVLLLGEATPLVFWRPRIGGSHLSNTSQGSVPDMNVSLPDEVIALARQVQTLSERVCVGVDLMQNSETKAWIVLEANNNAALASGAFNDEKAERYVQMVRNIIERE